MYRRLHTKAAEEASSSINEYLQFFKTPKDLRPLVYRPKNASELISRDLWDPVNKKRILPLNAPKIPSINKLTHLINDTTTIDELNELTPKIIRLSNHKINYTNEIHLINYLEKSAELRKFPHALTLLYSNNDLKHLLSYNILNSILSFLYLQGKSSAVIKTNVALKQIDKRNQITHLLRLAILQKFEPESSIHGLLKKIKNLENLKLPTLDTTKPPGASSYQLNKHRLLYLSLKPIDETLSEKFNELENIKIINKFVQDYEKIELKLNHQNAWTELANKSQFGKPEVEAEAAEEESKEPEK